MKPLRISQAEHQEASCLVAEVLLDSPAALPGTPGPSRCAQSLLTPGDECGGNSGSRPAAAPFPSHSREQRPHYGPANQAHAVPGPSVHPWLRDHPTHPTHPQRARGQPGGALGQAPAPHRAAGTQGPACPTAP